MTRLFCQVISTSRMWLESTSCWASWFFTMLAIERNLLPFSSLALRYCTLSSASRILFGLSVKNQKDDLDKAMLNIAFVFELLKIIKDFTRIQGCLQSILYLFFILDEWHRLGFLLGNNSNLHHYVLITLMDIPVDNSTKSNALLKFSHVDEAFVPAVLSLTLTTSREVPL